MSGESIQLLCGITAGLYWIKTTLQSADVGPSTEFYFLLGAGVFKLQRRATLRSIVPPGVRITYKITSVSRSVQPPGLVVNVLDLSTGGFRGDWPEAPGTQPKIGDHISGFLNFPNGRPLELFGFVKSVQRVNAGFHQVGVEFQPLGAREEQALLFVCLQALSRPF